VTPADIFLLIALGIFLTAFTAGLFLFASNLYTAANMLREINLSLSELAAQIKGLPLNLHGLPTATRKLSAALAEHAIQTGALVEVIRANIGVGGAETQTPNGKVDPRNPSGANWDASIPQPPDFDDGPPQPDAA